VIFANASIIGPIPTNLFIDRNDMIDVTGFNRSRIIIWRADNTTPIRIIDTDVTLPRSTVVDLNDTIVVANGGSNSSIQRWTLTATAPTLITSTTSICRDLFIDFIMNYLYCSQVERDRVLRYTLDNSSQAIVAGNGTPGSTSWQLNQPNGIVMDSTRILYVADSGNNRIQRFENDSRNGTTVSIRFNLEYPTGVIVDGDDNLYICDRGNRRILAQVPGDFRCIIGCGSSNSSSSILNIPNYIRFDRLGNLWVNDRGNHRVYKFALASNSTGESKL
jgi:sugar lactone lactonase YvrE